jgi:hypothetical protein
MVRQEQSLNDGRWAILIGVTIISILFGVYVMARQWSNESWLLAGIIMTVVPILSYFVLRRV